MPKVATTTIPPGQPRRLDSDTLRRLVEEGVKLRKEFETRTASTRTLTPDDLKTRSR